MIDDLLAFLRARLDEDEQAARAAAKRAASELATADRKAGWYQPPYDGSHWSNDYDHVHVRDHRPERNGRRVQIADCGHGALDLTSHLARHDPARVLAEVDAKRRIVEKCAAVQDGLRDDFTADWLADDVLELLALPYAGHPDYREEWRP